MRLKFLLSLVAVTGFLGSALGPNAAWSCDRHEAKAAELAGTTPTAQAVTAQASAIPDYPITVRGGTPADQRVEAVRRAGRQVSEEVSATSEAKLAVLARRVSKAARANGEAMIAVPLSVEFGIEANELATEIWDSDEELDDFLVDLRASRRSSLT